MGFVVIVFFVAAFLFRWQVLEYDRYRVLANQRVKDSQLASLRGSIYDSKGSPLAYSIPVYDVYAYIPEINDAEELLRQTREELVDKVSSALDLDKEDVEDILDTDLLYVSIGKQVSVEEKERLESLKTDKNAERSISGLHFEPAEKRIYPDGSLASHVLGFVGKSRLGEDVGRNGIEGYWNGDLAWKKGYLVEETDSFGNQILTGEYEPIFPKVGRSVRLTLDRGLQRVVEKKIKEGVKKWKAVSGSVVVMDPRTGEILAMANYPTYDPNEYWKVKDWQTYKNRTVTDAYEFGSVGKCFTAAAGIDLKKVGPDTLIFKHHEGCVDFVNDTQLCTASKTPAGPMDLTDVLANSDNIGAYYVSKKIGGENFYSYLKDFGMGRKTNAGFEEESTSLLKEGKYWNKADLAAYSYGQGYSATPLQVISALSAIANNGKRMQPYIVAKIYDEEETIDIRPKVAGKPITRETAIIANAMLTEVFDRNGSSWMFPELLNYQLAGKSGTASVKDISGLSYAEDKVNVTYVGWDSSDNPKFIMLMKLQEPEGAPYSVESVQPLWMETFLEIKDIVGVVPIAQK